ncbi:MAG TPA: hypothetical protein VFI12_03780 [Thermomicrobiales bacterium]|jgi:hypothetical protein|nr:hypothetical protein [Thermomicrobiales bacterium]
MTNRVRYYITESDDRPIVRSVPVTVSTQPANDLMVIEKQQTEPAAREQATARRPVGRIVKVLRKPSRPTRS